MANEYVNKVVVGSTAVIDLTGDTAVENKVLAGCAFHKASGAPAEGTCAFDVDSSGATAGDAEVLATKTFAKGGTMHTGTMPNRGAVSGTISTVAGEYTVPQGYHDGSGKVSIDATEQAKLIAGNIKSGVEVLGVTGNYTGEAISAQTKSITPSMSAQTVLPDTGYDYLSQVNVAAIPVAYADNAAGGQTVTIG